MSPVTSDKSVSWIIKQTFGSISVLHRLHSYLFILQCRPQPEVVVLRPAPTERLLRAAGERTSSWTSPQYTSAALTAAAAASRSASNTCRPRPIRKRRSQTNQGRTTSNQPMGCCRTTSWKRRSPSWAPNLWRRPDFKKTPREYKMKIVE